MTEPALSSAVAAALLLDEGVERVQALVALRERAPEATTDVLLGLLTSPEVLLRRRAAGSLGLFREHLGSKADVLTHHLAAHEDSRIRLSSAILLMNNPAAEVTSAYVHALGDPFEKVAQLACLELGFRGGPEATTALLGQLPHPNWRVRLEVCKALINLRSTDPRVVATLEAMDRDPEARDFDQESDEFARMDKELGLCPEGEAPWGRMADILARARKLLSSAAPDGPDGSVPPPTAAP